MPETIFKTFRAEVKGVNIETGEVDMLIPVSTASVDRDGEIVEPTAFKKTIPKFMKRPVLVASHDYRDLTNQIGEWTKLKITDTGIEGKPKYYINEGNEQADWGFKLATKGMAAFSIGFIPKEWEDGDGVKTPRRTYKEVELLEVSQVIVPSNREAIQGIRSKSVDPIVNNLIDDILKDSNTAKTEDALLPYSIVTKPEETEITIKQGSNLDDVYKNSTIIKINSKSNTPLITKPEDTGNMIRIPVDRGDHEGHRIRTIMISEKEGIKALYCGTDKVVMTYLFDKSKGWDMAKARAWVKEHEGKSISELTEHKISQEEIIDEIDYLSTLIRENGIAESAKKSTADLMIQIANTLKWEITAVDTDAQKYIKRITGSDIPEKDIVIGKKPTIIAQDVTDNEKIKLIIDQTIKEVVRKL